ncbi:putative protein DUf4339 [Aromatoleum bremense]|nr:putative protein DUf4339 [Aromatoleum bremense]
MNGWWYESRGNRRGPVPIELLKTLLDERQISLDTLVWREDMENWERLSSLVELAQMIPAAPPPLPKARPVTAGPWRRFWARTLDTWLELVVVVLLMLVVSRMFPSVQEWFSTPTGSAFFALTMLPSAQAVDATSHVIFGNTLGKALLGLHVANRNGHPLIFSEHLERNLGMWLRGIALGFPLIGHVAMWRQANRLRQKQLASYDESGGFTVLVSPVGGVHIVGFVVVFAALALVVLTLNTMDRTMSSKADLTATASVETNSSTTGMTSPGRWKNPRSGHEVMLPLGWDVSQKSTGPARVSYEFNDALRRTRVEFGFETEERRSINDYVQEDRNRIFPSVRFGGEGEYRTIRGHAGWSSDGIPSDNRSGAAFAVIIQTPEGFWWAASVIYPPTEVDRPDARALMFDLLKTAM